MLALPPQLIVMGVSGSGKTTLGRALAAHFGVTFLDADDFHTPQARARMARGEGLTDTQRAPWLARLHAELSERAARGEGVVLACSALKAAYRQQLGSGAQFIYLEVPPEVLWQRLERRPDDVTGGYARPSLLPSQLATLEPPTPGEALTVHVAAADPPQVVLARTLALLEAQNG